MDWVIENILSSFLVLPDGSVVLKENGNNSGNVGTTNDNIIAHIIILAYALCKIFGPNKELILKIIAALFGDDGVMALPHFTPDDWEETFRNAYLDFGLVLDPLVVSRDLEDHSFLGFRFKRFRNSWVPMYPIDRIIASFTYVIEQGMTDDDSLMKSLSLLLMSAPHDEFEMLAECYSYMLKLPFSTRTPAIEAAVAAGVPTKYECLAWMAGLEGTEVGTIYECFDNVRTKEGIPQDGRKETSSSGEVPDNASGGLLPTQEHPHSRRPQRRCCW